MSKVEISMHVFSGLENPKWTIDVTHHEFREIVDKVKKHTQTKMETGLGYSGFTVCYDDTIYNIRKQSDRELETLLLQSNEHAMDAHYSAHKHIISKIVKSHVLRQLDETSVKQQDLQLPEFNPIRWNTENCQPYNNCYNYANDMITNTFAQPGRAAGLTMEEITDKVVQRNATADGLQLLKIDESNDVPINCRNLVALVIWPLQDFHWYRLDNNTQFSHKPGQGRVRDGDENSCCIADPRKCNVDPYTFVTFMKTDPELVSID